MLEYYKFLDCATNAVQLAFPSSRGADVAVFSNLSAVFRYKLKILNRNQPYGA